MFVSWNSLSKFSCVCLPLKKLVNRKHFPVNGKHFPVNRNTFRSTKNIFQSKKNLVWFPGKCFPFWLCLFAIIKVGQRKTLSSQRKIWLGFQESVFLENLDGKHFPESCEKFKNIIICWLYQIWSSNFWLLYIICFKYLFFNSFS